MEKENQNLPKNMPEIPKDAENEQEQQKVVNEAKEITQEVKEQTQEIKEEVKEEVAEVKEEVKKKEIDLKAPPPPVKKEDLDSSLEEVKKKTYTIYQQYSQTLEKFEEASLKLIEQENEILRTTVADSMKLLNQLKVKDLGEIKESIQEIKLDNKEELLEIKRLSKGRFKGFIYGTLSAAAVAAALFAYGAKMLGLKLEPATFMQKNNLDLIAAKYIELLNLKGGALEGYALIGVVSFIVGLIVYKITTFLQSLKNKRYVQKVKEGSEKYEQKLKEKIEQLQKVIDHINKVS